MQPSAETALRPVPLSDARITSGFWSERQRVNRESSVPIGSYRLRDAGNLGALELAVRPDRQSRAGRGTPLSRWRAMYLAAGASDVAAELDDVALDDALRR